MVARPSRLARMSSTSSGTASKSAGVVLGVEWGVRLLTWVLQDPGQDQGVKRKTTGIDTHDRNECVLYNVKLQRTCTTSRGQIV